MGVSVFMCVCVLYSMEDVNRYCSDVKEKNLLGWKCPSASKLFLVSLVEKLLCNHHFLRKIRLLSVESVLESSSILTLCLFLFCLRRRLRSSCCYLQCVWCSTWRAPSSHARMLSWSTLWKTVSWWGQLDLNLTYYYYINLVSFHNGTQVSSSLKKKNHTWHTSTTDQLMFCFSLLIAH